MKEIEQNDNQKPIQITNKAKHEKKLSEVEKSEETKTDIGNFTSSIVEELCLIFSLNVDCFEEIFDLLSFEDLHEFGKTCKTIQKLAGDYFNRNFKAAEKFSDIDGIYTVYSNENGVLNKRTQSSGFNNYINYISHYYEEFEPLRYIQMHINEFISLNHIYFVCLVINPIKIEYFQQILHQIEVLQLRQCTLSGDFFEIILKFCKNLKRLYIQDDLGDIIDEIGNPWLLRTYPSIKHLQITTRYPFKIHELDAFFRQNSGILSFSTSSRCLWENRHELLKCSVTLERLEIQMLDNFYRNCIDIRFICDLLNQLFQRGFYRRLHLFVKRIDEKCSKELISVNGLESLSMRQFSECHDLPMLRNLKELAILDGAKATEMDILAKNLKNLERILIKNAGFSDILPFISHSKKLNRFKLTPKTENGFKDDILDLVKLNNSREKLKGAWKLCIYVPDNIFLKTKWSLKNGNINLNTVEMKRTDSYEWEQHQ